MVKNIFQFYRLTSFRICCKKAFVDILCLCCVVLDFFYRHVLIHHFAEIHCFYIIFHQTPEIMCGNPYSNTKLCLNSASLTVHKIFNLYTVIHVYENKI